ncbi:MAG: hypothetical protein U1C18_01260 [Patescibacteria group bacterium]|nr:hypothetical protein [Patescibacteria group bacterium]
MEAFEQSYRAGLSDEYIKPHVIGENGVPIGPIKDNDSVILFNHRSDRARQLAKVFVQKNFEQDNFGSFNPEPRPKKLRFVAMSDFGPDLGDIITAYPSKDLEETLPMALNGMRQLYVAETEKYAHITYFFNGGYADPVAGEDRIMVPSPDVRTYDESPGMATKGIADEIIKAVSQGTHDFIAANIACLDMVAHTGNFAAAQKALAVADQEIGRIVQAVAEKGGTLAVTADHGNIEEMKDLSSGSADTEHSKNQVPFIISSPSLAGSTLRQDGILGDVAPTILAQLGIATPKQMTGTSLFLR